MYRLVQKQMYAMCNETLNYSTVYFNFLYTFIYSINGKNYSYALCFKSSAFSLQFYAAVILSVMDGLQEKTQLQSFQQHFPLL